MTTANNNYAKRISQNDEITIASENKNKEEQAHHALKEKKLEIEGKIKSSGTFLENLKGKFPLDPTAIYKAKCALDLLQRESEFYVELEKELFGS
jgi:hypothetical protein